MAVTVTLDADQPMAFSPDDASGPYTIDFPLSPADGAKAIMIPKNTSATSVTLDGNGKNIVSAVGAYDAATQSVTFSGYAMVFVFFSGIDKWLEQRTP